MKEIRVDDLEAKLQYVKPIESALRYYMTSLWLLFRPMQLLFIVAIVAMVSFLIWMIADKQFAVGEIFLFAFFILPSFFVLGWIFYSLLKGLCSIFFEYKKGIFSSIFLCLYAASSIFFGIYFVLGGVALSLCCGRGITPFWIHYGLSFLLLVVAFRDLLRGVSGVRALDSSDALLCRPEQEISFFPLRRFRNLTAIPQFIDYLRDRATGTKLLFGLGGSLVSVVFYNALNQPVFVIKDFGSAVRECSKIVDNASCMERQLNLSAWISLSSLCLVLPLSLYLGNRILAIAQRRATLPMHQLKEYDKRNPVLFLRSFLDDQIPLPRAKASLTGKALQFGLPAESLDTILLRLGSYHGPVVALGSPSDEIQPFGASRGYFDGITWKQAVCDLMAESNAIVLVLDDTSGVLWELQQLSKTEDFKKTLFLIHPKFSIDKVARLRLMCEVSAVLGSTAPELMLALDGYRPVLGFFWAKGAEATIAYSESFSELAFEILIRWFFASRQAL